jgi:hypothetical protein
MEQSSLLGRFASYEENKVLGIWLQAPKVKTEMEKKNFKWAVSLQKKLVLRQQREQTRNNKKFLSQQKMEFKQKFVFI